MVELMAPGPLEDKVLGSANAHCTIVEYASMTCSHCADFATQVFPELKKRYIDTGKVRFILREFPLDKLAAGAFMLARCGGGDSKERYYDLVEMMFQQQRQWLTRNPLPPLFNLVKQAGFSQQSFDACLKDQAMFEKVMETRDRATKFGVNSTPTFFINGKMHVGVASMEELEKLIEPYLKA
jgi:protein-disulfide isomerase